MAVGSADRGVVNRLEPARVFGMGFGRGVAFNRGGQEWMATADQTWMRRALALARRGTGLTSPNPAVGAVLVRGNRVIGEGWHRRAGGPHAEVEALRDALRRGEWARGATLYVTLEPCSTTGRTPPCTEAIKAAGIRRVVVGASDPNPRHRGRGLRVLRAAGVEVARADAVLAAESAHLNRGFNRWITTGRPWVIAKMAMSLDGRTVTAPGEDRWITGPEARRRAHELRLMADAIAVGAGTVRADNPALTVRLGARSRGKVQPWRVVFTRSGEVPAGAAVLADRHAARTLVFQGRAWDEALADLGGRGVAWLLIEGGMGLWQSAFAAGVVDEVAVFVAPKVLGGPGADGAFLVPAVEVGNLRAEGLGRDVLLGGLVRRDRGRGA